MGAIEDLKLIVQGLEEQGFDTGNWSMQDFEPVTGRNEKVGQLQVPHEMSYITKDPDTDEDDLRDAVINGAVIEVTSAEAGGPPIPPQEEFDVSYVVRRKYELTRLVLILYRKDGPYLNINVSIDLQRRRFYDFVIDNEDPKIGGYVPIDDVDSVLQALYNQISPVASSVNYTVDNPREWRRQIGHNTT